MDLGILGIRHRVGGLQTGTPLCPLQEQEEGRPGRRRRKQETKPAWSPEEPGQEGPVKATAASALGGRSRERPSDWPLLGLLTSPSWTREQVEGISCGCS